jgi:hypothetical protein
MRNSSATPAADGWSGAAQRQGAAAVDYVLGLGVVLPLLAVVLPAGRRIMQLVYEFTCTVVAWPFM